MSLSQCSCEVKCGSVVQGDHKEALMALDRCGVE